MMNRNPIMLLEYLDFSDINGVHGDVGESMQSDVIDIFKWPNLGSNNNDG